MSTQRVYACMFMLNPQPVLNVTLHFLGSERASVEELRGDLFVFHDQHRARSQRGTTYEKRRLGTSMASGVAKAERRSVMERSCSCSQWSPVQVTANNARTSVSISHVQRSMTVHTARWRRRVRADYVAIDQLYFRALKQNPV